MGTKTNRIHTFLNCARCAREKPPNISPEKYARIQAGLTGDGLQVWCVRHALEIVHFTPPQLTEFLARGPMCACCEGGMHRS